MVTRLTCPHNGVIPPPVPLSEALRDNQVERVAHCFGGREAKETLGGRVPQHNQTLDIGDNNRVPSRMDQGMQIHLSLHAGLSSGVPDEPPRAVPCVWCHGPAHPALGGYIWGVSRRRSQPRPITS